MRHHKIVMALALMGVGTAFAEVPQGTQSFADLGIPEANGSPTGNILTATTFTIGDLVSTAAQSGVFEGMALQSFGAITFNVNSPGSLVFKDGAFGSFTSTFIDPTETVTHAGTTIAFFMVGNWMPGTQGRVSGGPFPSDLTISFTQTPGADGVISDSATFATPAVQASVPEPATLGLLALGLGGIWLMRRRK